MKSIIKEKEYEVFYRERGNKNGNEYSCIVTCNSKEEARKNFNEFDNDGWKWTITKIEKII